MSAMALPELLYLSRKDVENVELTMKDIIEVVEESFHEKEHGRVEMPPKPGLHPKGDAFIHAMPAYIPKLRSAGIKWVSGFPENYMRGLPYITGLVILNDPETGIPVCVMDATWITAKRTGAATGVAAKYLAKPGSRIVGTLGCGVQGRSILEALSTVLKGLEEVRAYDVKEENLRRYVEETKRRYGLRVVPVSSARESVEGCDIVVTAGPISRHPKPVIEASWLEEGGFACALDFDSYWKPEAMQSMDKFCADDLEQLMYYKAQGYFSGIPRVYADLGEIVTNKKPGRGTGKERIMAMNLGSAILDVATAIKIYEKARKKGIGTWLPL